MMSFADSIADDYKVTDGAQTVTFTSVGAAGPHDITITNADGHAFGAKEIAASQGFFNYGDKLWLLGNNQIDAAYKPKPGDRITDASSVVWEILDATLDDFGVSWQCTCRKAR